MDLKNLLTPFEGIEIYQPADQNSLFEIFERQPMKLPGFNLIYDRTPDFTALLKHQANDHQTLVLRRQGKIGCFFSFSWGPRYVNGQKKMVAYISDFRVQDHRLAAKVWRSFYGKFLGFLLEQKMDYLLTAVLASNKEALQSLVVRAPENGFYYHPLAPQNMINLIRKKPIAVSASSLLVEKVKPEDTEKLRKFIDSVQRKKIFGYVFEGEGSEWDRRKTDWKNWRPQDFLVIKKGSDIIACTLPWSPTPIKRMRLSKVAPVLKFFFKFSSLIGLPLPKENQNLETLYLTNLNLSDGLSSKDRQNCVLSFCEYVFQNRQNYFFQMLSLADTEGDLLAPLQKFYFLQSTPVNLYQASTDSSPRFSEQSRISFEMALV